MISQFGCSANRNSLFSRFYWIWFGASGWGEYKLGAAPISWVLLQYGSLGVVAIAADRLLCRLRSMQLRWLRWVDHAAEVGRHTPQTSRTFEQRGFGVDRFTGVLEMTPLTHTFTFTEIDFGPSLSAAHLRKRPT